MYGAGWGRLAVHDAGSAPAPRATEPGLTRVRAPRARHDRPWMQITRAEPTAAQRPKPKDIGLQTEKRPDQRHAPGPRRRDPFPVDQRRPGNGSLMPASTSAVHFAAAGQEATMNAATVSLPSPTVTAQLGKAPRSSTNSSASRVQGHRPPLPRTRTSWLSSTPTATVATPPSSRPTGTPIRRTSPPGAVPSGPAWAPPSEPLRNTSFEVAIRALGRPCFLAVGASCHACRTGARSSPAR